MIQFFKEKELFLISINVLCNLLKFNHFSFFEPVYQQSIRYIQYTSVANGTFLQSSSLIKTSLCLFPKKIFLLCLSAKRNIQFSLYQYFFIFLKIRNIFLNIYQLKLLVVSHLVISC